MAPSSDSDRLVLTAYFADDIPESDVDAQVRALEALYAEVRHEAPDAEVSLPSVPADGYRGGDAQTVVVIVLDMASGAVVNVVSGIVIDWLRRSRNRRLREQRPNGENTISGTDPPPGEHGEPDGRAPDHGDGTDGDDGGDPRPTGTR